MYITTPPPLPHSNFIRQSGFRFRFPFRYFLIWSVIIFRYVRSTEFLFSNHVLYISLFPHTHIHLRINPCILSSYPHHAYCTLSLRSSRNTVKVDNTDTCSRFTTLTCVLFYSDAVLITWPASFFDYSPTLHPLLRHSSIRSSY
jgi:hypothetical protein